MTQKEINEKFRKLLKARDYIRNLQNKTYEIFEKQIDELDKELEKLIDLQWEEYSND